MRWTTKQLSRIMAKVGVPNYTFNKVKQSVPTVLSRAFSQFSAFKECWNCGQAIPREQFICAAENCGAIQPDIQDMNYFAMFNIPVSYSVDKKVLEFEYKKSQKLLHPDKFAQKSIRIQETSTNLSSITNHAYATLMNPLLRAEYMLLLIHRQKVFEEDALRLDADLMMEMFEWREKVDDAKLIPDHRKSLIEEIGHKLSVCEKNISESIEDPSQTSRAILWTTKLKYFSKMMEELAEHEE